MPQLARANRGLGVTAVLTMYTILTVAGTQPLAGQDLTSDLTTTAKAAGGLTEGYVEAAVSPSLGLRINFLENTSLSDEAVANTRFSTQVNSTTRREIDVLLSMNDFEPEWLRSAYVGVSFIRIDELQRATFVQVDEIGEFGTDYTNSRNTNFVSPRLGIALRGRWDADAAFWLTARYDLTVSPLFYLFMAQEMTYDSIDGGSETFANEFTTWSSPYLNHEFSLQLADLLRIATYHSFLHIPYQTLEPTADGASVVPVDETALLNTLRLDGDLTLRIAETISFNIGAGYEWTWTDRLRGGVAFGSTTAAGSPYFRIGAGFAD